MRGGFLTIPAQRTCFCSVVACRGRSGNGIPLHQLDGGFLYGQRCAEALPHWVQLAYGACIYVEEAESCFLFSLLLPGAQSMPCVLLDCSSQLVCWLSQILKALNYSPVPTAVFTHWVNGHWWQLHTPESTAPAISSWCHMMSAAVKK